MKTDKGDDPADLTDPADRDDPADPWPPTDPDQLAALNLWMDEQEADGQ